MFSSATIIISITLTILTAQSSPQAKKELTTEEGAKRLGASLGLAHWQTTNLLAPPARPLQVVATPPRHGPAGLDRGAVNGFVLTLADKNEGATYVSGDTLWYEDIAEIARRLDIRVGILHLGAARVAEVGPFQLTMTAEEACRSCSPLRKRPDRTFTL